MEQAATNLVEVAADFVSLWNPKSSSWVNVREVFVEKGQITSPVTVTIPVADEVETLLTYPNPTAAQIPDLKGLMAYLEQQQRLAGPGVTNKYVNVKRKNYFIFEGDTHITNKLITVQNVKRPTFTDVYAPTLTTKKIIHQKVVRPTTIFENASPL